jgi:hypothetical protein
MTSETTLASPVHEVADAFEANELFQRNDWTDGLPIVPPPEAGTCVFLQAAGLKAEDVVGVEQLVDGAIESALGLLTPPSD